MERFGCRPVKPNHLKCYDRTAAALLRTRFPIRHTDFANLLLIILPPAAVFSRARLLIRYRNRKSTIVIPMAAEPLITTYLEIRSWDQLCPKRAGVRFQIWEKTNRDWRFNRDLYFRVGEQWDWIDKRSWTDDQWKEYATASELRTFAGYYDDALAGYYELRRDSEGGIEIAYFGLLPGWIGRELGGALLTSARKRVLR